MNASFRKINRSYSKGRLANTLKIESPISNFSRENILDSDSFFQIFSDKFVTQGGGEKIDLGIHGTRSSLSSDNNDTQPSPDRSGGQRVGQTATIKYSGQLRSKSNNG